MIQDVIDGISLAIDAFDKIEVILENIVRYLQKRDLK